MAKYLRVSSSAVQVPSDMIAIGDGVEDILGAIFPRRSGKFQSQVIGDVHTRGANVVFCDGHAEYAKQDKWTEESEAARKRWNNDHEAHPETW